MLPWKPYFDVILLAVLIFVSIGFGYRLRGQAEKGEPLFQLPKRKPGPAEDEMDELEDALLSEGDFK